MWANISWSGRRRAAAGMGAFVASVIVVSCFPPVEITPPPADAPAAELALAGAAVLIGTGDIAVCGTPYDEATARLVDSVSRADSVAGVEDAIFTTGDNWYPTGSRENRERCWKPSWGDSTKRIMSRLRPTLGNHDLQGGFGEAYFELFGKSAGEKGKGYYAYDLGAWRVIALNSEIVTNPAYSVETRREQEEWLKKELASNTKKCTVAYFHRPRFSSGGHAGEYRMTGLWDIMYEGNVDVVINGHEHHYERFEPHTPAGLRDTVRGITQFIVGTGGAGLTGIRVPPAANSARRIQGHFGVLKLTLGAEEYQHAFLDTQGRVWDRAAGKCH
jgi:3',5'-cyclic AMP phosphodiesterase CpdA